MSERRTGAPSSKSAHIAYVQQRYLEGASLGEISREIDKSVQTLSRWLQEDGITIEPRPRDPNVSRSSQQRQEIAAKISATKKGKRTGGRQRLPRETRSCATCGTPFEARVDQPEKRFCSVSCARQHDGKVKHKKVINDYLASPESKCECGETIPYDNRHSWKYCSDECRNTYGKKKQANPNNYVTFNCQGCGNETTRYKKYGSGALKFCSNACAMKHTKTVKHYVVRDMDMVLDSGWEALFAGLCMFLKIPIERYDRDQGVEWKPGHHYAPDFYLPSLSMAIEIKGNEDPDDFGRWTAFQEQVGTLIVLDRDRLSVLRFARDPVEWLTRLQGAPSCELGQISE